MTTEDPQRVVLALLERLRADETLMRVAAEAAHNQGLANKMLPEAEVLRHAMAIMDAVTAVASGDPAQIARTMAAADDVTIDRLEQGISLDDVLQGFRVGRSVLVDRLIHIGRDMIGPDALLPLLVPMDAIVGEFQERMILAYRAGERDLLRSRHSAQLEALRELLSGGALAWATEACLDPGASYHCMVADVSVPRTARRLERTWLAQQGISGIVHGYLCCITTELPPPEALPDLVVVSPRVAVSELAGTYALCRQALATYRMKRAAGRQWLLEAGQDIATAAQPLLGTMLARELLANMDPADEFHRELALTAQIYIASGRRAEEAAASLHLHTNTLRYRLRRFNELNVASTPPAGRSLASDLHTWWALRTWLAGSDE